MRENLCARESPDCTKVEEKASIDREAFLSKGGEEKAWKGKGREGEGEEETRQDSEDLRSQRKKVWFEFFWHWFFLFVFASLVRRI